MKPSFWAALAGALAELAKLFGLASKEMDRHQLVTSNASPNFLPNLLDWTVDRRDRTFHVYVVEPNKYEPKNHSTIFDAAINVFIDSWRRQLCHRTKPQACAPLKRACA